MLSRKSVRFHPVPGLGTNEAIRAVGHLDEWATRGYVLHVGSSANRCEGNERRNHATSQFLPSAWISLASWIPRVGGGHARCIVVGPAMARFPPTYLYYSAIRQPPSGAHPYTGG